MKINNSQLMESLEKGMDLTKGRRILHTAPHHDDILLAYHPLLQKLIENNENFFAYVTSGFNSVTDAYIIKILNRIDNDQVDQISSIIIKNSYEYLLRSFLEEVRLNNVKGMELWEEIILLRNIKTVFSLHNAESLKQKKEWLLKSYFAQKKPNEKDSFEIQTLKGSLRESESDRKLLMLDVELSQVFHMRSKFYSQGTEIEDEDVSAFLELLETLKPDVITVASDAEGKGPATHHKVYQLIRKALKAWQHKTITIWCYRNVWSRYQLSEATLIVPVTELELAAMNHTFQSCFPTQVKAAFPSEEFAGPFSGLAEKIMREQYSDLKILLGDSYFKARPVLQNAAGLIYLQEKSHLCL